MERVFQTRTITPLYLSRPVVRRVAVERVSGTKNASFPTFFSKIAGRITCVGGHGYEKKEDN